MRPTCKQFSTFAAKASLIRSHQRAPQNESQVSKRRASETITCAKDLHFRILAGDSAAVSELLQSFAPTLIRRLRQTFTRVSEVHIVDGVDEAVVDYVLRPTQYDSHIGVSLFRYLYWASRRNVLDYIRSESRRRGRERAYAELITATNGDDHCAQRSRQLEQVMDLCNDVTWSSRDQRTLHRFLEGERNPAVLASVLGVSNRSPHEQRAEIKRFKDRVIKRLRRLVQATRSQQTM